MKKKKFYITNTDHYLNLVRQNITFPQRTVLITFDDGFKSFFHRAWPILKDYGYSASLFIVTGKIGLMNDWESKNYLSLLNEKEITRLWREGLELGAHSHLHQNLPKLNPKELAKEVISSRHPEGMPEVKLHYFSYPYGYFNQEVKNEVEETGFLAAFSVQHGGKDLFEIRRVPIYRHDSFFTFRFKVSGYYFLVFDLVRKLIPKRFKSKNE